MGTLSAHLLTFYRSSFQVAYRHPYGTYAIDTPFASYQGSWCLRYGSLENKCSVSNWRQATLTLQWLRWNGIMLFPRNSIGLQVEEPIDTHADCEHSRALTCTTHCTLATAAVIARPIKGAPVVCDVKQCSHALRGLIKKKERKEIKRKNG